MPAANCRPQPDMNWGRLGQDAASIIKRGTGRKKDDDYDSDVVETAPPAGVRCRKCKKRFTLDVNATKHEKTAFWAEHNKTCK